MRANWTCWLSVLALGGAGCSFQVNPVACTEDCGPVDAPPPDTLVADAAPPLDSAPDAFVPAFCDPASGALLACFALEGSAQDGSPNNLDGTLTGVAFVAGRVGQAARLESASTFVIGESALLDPPAITMEAWIRPAALPANGARAGIVDNNGQYGLFLHPGGDLQCIGLQATAMVQADVWTHVACTYDGTTRLYANGVEVDASASGGAPLGSSGTTGTSIGGDNPAGSPLVGDLDQIRIFGVARTAAQICAAADASPCP